MTHPTQEDDVKAPTKGDGFWINKISATNLRHICQSGSATCMLPALVNATDAVEDAKALIESQGRLLARLEQAERDTKRIDWLADKDNHIGNVQLPEACVMANLHSLRGAIDAAIASEAKP